MSKIHIRLLMMICILIAAQVAMYEIAGSSVSDCVFGFFCGLAAFLYFESKAIKD